MFRRRFYAISALVLAGIVAGAFVRPQILWLLLVVGPLVAIGMRDALQRQRTVLRNFPLIGHGRYLLEMVRPEIQQYFIESNIDAFPIERELRSIVYQRAKGELETKPFGTQRDVYRVGYEWAAHSIAPVIPLEDPPRLTVGGPDCKQPYAASLLNISAMSFGSLSSNAILALNRGARKGGFAHNTGEGGLSPFHLEPGGDLIWQVGTGYFGCRDVDGGFDPKRFEEQVARDSIRMIELKLSQGAKPGHGGILPAGKVTEEIARIRGVPVGKTVFSPPAHQTFRTPRGLIEFLLKLRDLSGGKPVGFKLSVGHQAEFLAVCKAMIETGMTPDFITVDGGEGGTGAAPLEFSGLARYARSGRVDVRPQLPDRLWTARPNSYHRRGEDTHRISHGPRSGAGRGSVRVRPRHDARPRLYPGASLQHKQVPHGCRNPGSGSDAWVGRDGQNRAGYPVSQGDSAWISRNARGDGASPHFSRDLK